MLATAPVASTDKLSPSPPPKVELSDIKWTAPPLHKIKALTEEPASVKHFTHSIRKRTAKPTKNSELTSTNDKPVQRNSMYNLDRVKEIQQTHHKPKQTRENDAMFGGKMLHLGFDLLSGFRGPRGTMTTQDWLNRCLVLETVARVSGMVEGVARHLRSHSVKPYNSWIHKILEGAENERMHMNIFMNMKEPGWLFQVTVLAAQGVLFPVFFLTYLVSPRTCHRLDNFLEKETNKTHTQLLDDMEHGHLDEWCTMTAPQIGRSYYNLPDDAKVYDMIKCIRADETNHRYVNHTVASVDQMRSINPFVGQH